MASKPVKLTRRGRPRKHNTEDDTIIPVYTGETRLPPGWKPPDGCVCFDTRTLGDCWRVRERVSTIDWFEKNIVVDGRTSDFPGSFSRLNFPYQVGFFDCFDDIEVRQISLQWGTQLGKSFSIQNLTAKIADCDPSPMMFGCPDEPTAREISEKRIMPSIEKIPRLAVKLLPEARRNVLQPDLGDCFIFMAWSGSPSTMGQRSCRYVFCTEVSKWDKSKSDEADSLALVGERVKSFWDSKIVYEGTPNMEGSCRIENLGRNANQRLRFHVACPHCGKKQILWFKDPNSGQYQLKWEKVNEKNDPDLAEQTAYYECVHCLGKIYDIHKKRMLISGIWAEDGIDIPDNFVGSVYFTPGKPKTRIHFDLSSLYSPVVTFGTIAARFIIDNSSAGPKKLQNFVNSWLAEVYKPKVKEYDWKALNILRADTPIGNVPEWVQFITAGVDIGRSCAHFSVRGWGYGGRSRLISCGIVNYKAVDLIAFDAIEANILQQVWGPRNMPVVLCGVDSGYQTYAVYGFCIQMNRKYGERVRPIKGKREGPPYYSSKQERSGANGVIIPGGINLWIINDPYWKEFLTGKYTIPSGEPGAYEVPADASETYLRSLSSEIMVEKQDARGNIVYQWEVIDKVVGNHYFDSEKISAVMADMCGWRNLTESAPVVTIQRQQIQSQDDDVFTIGDGSFTIGGNSW